MHDCAYCDGEATRVEPFGDEMCCDHCFNALIGDANAERPWACGCDGRGE